MRKKKKRDSLRYITSSALLMMVAFLLAVTSTLAWFSMSISSSITGMEFEIATKENLVIGVKQWKHREVIATREVVQRYELTKSTENNEYSYYYGGTLVTALDTNIYNLNNKAYVFVLPETGEEIIPSFVVDYGTEYCVFFSGDTLIDGNIYSGREETEDGFLLSGYFLEMPAYEDYTNEITESQLAKICMNDRNAEKITDSLTNATTLNDSDGLANGFTHLVDQYGNPFQPNRLTSDSRHTMLSGSMPETTVYKYEFDLFFASESSLGLILNTNHSGVRSQQAVGKKFDVEAWRDIVIADHTTDIKTKQYYETKYSNGTTVSKGSKIFTEAKNAIRVGFSTLDGAPIGIWDPNASSGWTKNDPESNLALEYFNAKNSASDGTTLVGQPAKAQLTSSTLLFDSMTEAGDGRFYAGIKVTIWLEGFDADCFDSIMNEALTFRFDFAARPPKEE